MKTYFVIYKLYRQPGLSFLEVKANNKAEAKAVFLESRIKHDHIIKVVLEGIGE
jgi:hypothetical protein